MKKHSKTPGIRICVFKPDAKDLTNIYVGKDTLSAMLDITDGDEGAITHAARYASLTSDKVEGEAWSKTVLAAARKILIAAKAKQARAAREAAEAEEAAQAAAENKVWDQLLAAQ